MLELWTVLVPILLADVLNPVLFAFLVYAAGTDRPILNSSSMLLGHTAAYFGAGLLLAIVLDPFLDRLKNPQSIDLAIEIGLGVVLVVLALPSRKPARKRPEEKQPEPGALSSFTTGAIVNFIGIPFAVPYFAALAHIEQADLSQPEFLGVLLVYNLGYALPFASVPLLRAVLGDAAGPLLQRMNGSIERAASKLMPFVLAVLGVALIADGIAYFTTGEPLF